MRIITLTSDFGNDGGYVAAMKGVILETNPDARIIDITHEIRPQDIAEASFVLSTVFSYFPENTVHLAVVDPGVGTARRGIAVKTPDGFFVGPDNGTFTHTLRDFYPDPNDILITGGKMPLPPEVTAVNLTNPGYWRREVSATFHGRDIFAPVAAHLARGVPVGELGEAIPDITALPGYRPVRVNRGGIIGHVIHIDHFGNVITDIRRRDLPGTPIPVSIEIGGHTIKETVKTYAEGTGLMSLFGSSGYLEIAVRDGNAARSIRAAAGDEVKVSF